uniref:Dirigent protein n=1 Tax=Zea mays TaxID=4577 RepID=A0A804RA92_MAIZE
MSSCHRRPIFTDEGPIGSRWLRALTRPDALRPTAVTVVDERLRDSKEFGLPLDGTLQGVLVVGVADNGGHMVSVKASFAGDGADDSISFFGVRRDDQEESHVAVVGGTGRYTGASGFAVVHTHTEKHPPQAAAEKIWTPSWSRAYAVNRDSSTGSGASPHLQDCARGLCERGAALVLDVRVSTPTDPHRPEENPAIALTTGKGVRPRFVMAYSSYYARWQPGLWVGAPTWPSSMNPLSRPRGAIAWCRR